MQGTNAAILVFLGSCLAITETVLVTVAVFTEVNPNLAACFTLMALGMVLTTLVFIYWRNSALLTLRERTKRSNEDSHASINSIGMNGSFH